MDQSAAPPKLLDVAVARKTVPQGGAHVENMVCFAMLFAMNSMTLAALTHNAQISLMIRMPIVNIAKCI